MRTVCNTYWDAGKGNMTAQNTRKHFGGRGSAPDPARKLTSAPANPLVGGDGQAVPSPRTPSPTLRPSGLASPTPHSKISSEAVVHSPTNCTPTSYTTVTATKIIRQRFENFLNDSISGVAQAPISPTATLKCTRHWSVSPYVWTCRKINCSNYYLKHY